MTPLPTKQQSNSYSSPFSATIKQRRTGPTSLNTTSSCRTTKHVILKHKYPKQKTNQALPQSRRKQHNTYFAPNAVYGTNKWYFVIPKSSNDRQAEIWPESESFMCHDKS